MATDSKVKKGPSHGLNTIVWPCKLQDEIFQLFASRYRLHKHVCTHHTVKAYEYLIVEILKRARAKVENFMDLTDSIVTCRLHSEFRDLQERIARKEIPVLVGEKRIDTPIESDCPYPRKILELIVDKFYIGLSSSEENPLMNVPYEALDGKIFSLDAQDLRLCQPVKHKEIIIRMYTQLPNKIEDARRHWKSFW